MKVCGLEGGTNFKFFVCHDCILGYWAEEKPEKIKNDTEEKNRNTV